MKKYITLFIILALFGFFLLNWEEISYSLQEQKITVIAGTEDCGYEENIHGLGYNFSIRQCFLDNFKACSLAKISQKRYTIEGDPVIYTAVIEGFYNDQCNIHVYRDSKDRYGYYGKSDTICTGAELIDDSGRQEKSLILSNCRNGNDVLI